jgi:hypothetical protein
MTIMKKMKTMFPINFLTTLNMMMISVETEHGEMSWENPLGYKLVKNFIYLFHSKTPTQLTPPECSLLMPLPFSLPMLPPFSFSYSQLSYLYAG